jgi:cytidylate kinase
MDRHSIIILKEYFDRLLLKSESITESTVSKRPFITLSRQTGAGGFDFSDRLLSVINSRVNAFDEKWSLFDKNILEKVLEDNALPKEIGKFMPEKRISEFQNVIEQLFGLHPSEHKLVHKISVSIYHLAFFGNIILVGRGANIITAGLDGGVHIRLIEPIDKRVKHAMDHFELDKSTAHEFILNEDKGRKEYIKKYYSKNIEDCNLYSFVINFAKMSKSNALELIADMVIK